MGDRMSFGDLEPQGQRRKAGREEFLERMDAIAPWDRRTAPIEPHCRSRQRGRHVRGAEAMPRMHLLQAMSGLSDGGTEDAIPDSRAMQRSMHTGLMREQVPDATAPAKLRHILERKGLGKAMLGGLDPEPEAAGAMMRGGSIVDAAFIEAPGSTKNEGHSRGPEAHQSRKGKSWHFGFKAHIGPDAGSGLVHAVETAAANVSDVAMAHSLVRGDDRLCQRTPDAPGWRSAPRPPPARTSHRCGGPSPGSPPR